MRRDNESRFEWQVWAGNNSAPALINVVGFIAALSPSCPQVSLRCLSTQGPQLPKKPQRKVTRSVHEPSRDVARLIAQTINYAISCKLRKKVEILFAHLRRILKLDRLRLRGPCGAQDEFPSRCPAGASEAPPRGAQQPPRTSESRPNSSPRQNQPEKSDKATISNDQKPTSIRLSADFFNGMSLQQNLVSHHQVKF